MDQASSKALRHRDRREQILAVAHQLVTDKGHENVSLRGVARGSGLSPPALYEYFDGKEAIFEALSNQAGDALRATLEETLTGAPGTAADQLVRVGLAYIHFARARPEDFLMLFSRATGSSPGLTHEPDTPLQPMLHAAHCGLLTGEFEATSETETIAYGLWSLAHGIATLHATGLQGPCEDVLASDAMALRAYVSGLSN